MAAVEFAETIVIDPLPRTVNYRFRNRPVVLSAEEAAQQLWRGGQVPIWIDMHVVSADKDFTTLEISASSTYADSDLRLRYKQYGFPPFQPLGPEVPFGWRADSSEKLNLNWRKNC